MYPPDSLYVSCIYYMSNGTGNEMYDIDEMPNRYITNFHINKTIYYIKVVAIKESCEES